MSIVLYVLLTTAILVAADQPHPVHPPSLTKLGSEEQESSYWRQNAQKAVAEKLKLQLNTNEAKNVILFLGDGMSIPTLAATRSYLGDEGTPLFFEQFPFAGLSKTYCVDYKVADSACSATAYLCGVKNNEGTLGVNAHVQRGDCDAMRNSSNHVESIAKWFQDKDFASGVVTTTRITHATPAGLYSHTADRDWENDLDVINHSQDPSKCEDIAHQLITKEPGRNFNVIMGGGRQGFVPDGQGGYRQDGLNLIDAWKLDKESRNQSYTYVNNSGELSTLMSKQQIPTYLFGLFAQDHISDHLRNVTEEPKLEEMTSAAIRVLQATGKKYFLLVEGGKIDLAHHANLAQIALDETVEFSKAVALARGMTSEEDTLIVVTADHAHTMSYNGYPRRESSILKFSGSGSDGKPYTSLSYANGPGFKLVNGARPDITNDNTEKFDYVFPAAVPLGSESHGGDDVAVFASGPWAHLFTGSFEENVIPHAMAFASCVGAGLTTCETA